jgi:hypothetical protein
MTSTGGDLPANSPHFPCRLPTVSTTRSHGTGDAETITTRGPVERRKAPPHALCQPTGFMNGNTRERRIDTSDSSLASVCLSLTPSICSIVTAALPRSWPDLTWVFAIEPLSSECCQRLTGPVSAADGFSWGSGLTQPFTRCVY